MILRECVELHYIESSLSLILFVNTSLMACSVLQRGRNGSGCIVIRWATLRAQWTGRLPSRLITLIVTLGASLVLFRTKAERRTIEHYSWQFLLPDVSRSNLCDRCFRIVSALRLHNQFCANLILSEC